MFTLAKLVVVCCQVLVELLSEVCDAGEDILMKGTKWNILNNIKKEQEYYQIFFESARDQYNKDQPDPEWGEQDRIKAEE